MKKRRKQLITLSLAAALFMGRLAFSGAGTHAAEIQAVSTDEAPAIFEASPYFGGTDDIFTNRHDDTH